MNKVVRIVIGIIVVAGLSILGYWGYLTYLARVPPEQTPPAPQTLSAGGPVVVSAEGRVVPRAYVNLGFSSGGRIEEVFFDKGDWVQAEQVLARLENQEQLEAAIATAQLELLSAQQALDALYEQADLLRAQAEQAAAEASDTVRLAQWQVDSLDYQPSQSELAAAQAAVDLAAALKARAQTNYNEYSGLPEDDPHRAAALLALSGASEAYNLAVRRYNYLTGTASDIEVAKAQANLALAEAQLAEYERQVGELQTGPDPDQVDLAQARLANAEAQLAAAQAARQDLELRAPFAGQLVLFDIKAGEFANPGLPLVLLADISTWRVETTDLAEADVALLAAGMSATITLDAFPNETFAGQIVAIDLRGQDSRGSVTYTVTLAFDPGDVPVRWGMTAFVDIELP
jgi:multidrug efflux pump subunit AcrA (membrane-fusion protein)